jgi:RNA polymerase sigma-70 factor (ECF subfamily)
MDGLMDPAALDMPGATAPLVDRLVERARRGDEVSFETLIRSRVDGLFRTAWAILGDEADARDAVQEACVQAWRNIPRLRDADRFDPWISRILVNACRTRLRSRSRTRVREIRLAPELDRPGPASDDPANHAEADAVARAFDRLRPESRSILVLHHLGHQPIADIAVALGIPAGTVKSRLHTARAELTKALEWERG